MLFGNTVEFPQMTLRLVPEVFNAIDVILLVCKELGMVDATVLEIRYIQYVVPPPAVGINDAVRNDFPLDDGNLGVGPGIRNDLRVNHSSKLQQPENRDLPGGPTAPFAAKVGFINFDLATENRTGFLFKIVNDDLTQSMEIVNCGFAIDADKGRGTSCRCPNYKILNQTILFRFAQSASSHTVHGNT